SKDKLLRFLKRTKEFDALKNLGERGFYICLNCIRGEKVKKMKINVEKVKEKLRKQIIGLIQLGWRSRHIKIGFDDTLKEIRKGKKGFLILAEDVAERTKRNILREFQGDYFCIFKKSQLGNFIGKGEVGIVFVPETKFGLKLKNLLVQYLELDFKEVTTGCKK
ncbi:MAG: hypothetical protein D6831_03920, partial [Aquificota bacterium]